MSKFPSAKHFSSRKTILLPIGLLTLLVSLLNPSWLYNPYGSIDHWGYLGEMYSFPKLQLLFPGHPGNDLLPLILPGALLYKIFTPFLANYFQGLIFLALSLYCLFLLIQDDIDTVTAATTVCFAAGYQFLLSAIGSDYTDGKVIPYYLLTLYFTSATRKDGGHFKKFAILSGAVFALMVFTAVLSLVYLPVVLLYFAMDFRQMEGSGSRYLLRRVVRFLPFFVLGGVASTLSLGAIHFLYTGNFIFFSNTVAKAIQFSHSYSPPPLKTWASHASWLLLPFLTVIANLVFIITEVFRNKSRGDWTHTFDERHLYALLNITSLVIMLSVEILCHQSTLQHLYFDQTLPLTFLGLAVILAGSKPWEVSKQTILPMAALIFSVVVLLTVRVYNQDLQKTLIDRLNSGHLHLLLFLGGSGVLGGGILMYLFQIMNKLWTRLAVLAVAATINLFSFSPSFSAPTIAGEPQIFRTTIKWMDFFETVDPTRIGHFWYNESEPYGFLFKQFYAASDLNIKTLRINNVFPSLDEFVHPPAPLPAWQRGQEGNPPAPGDVIIVCTQYPNAITLARKALADFYIGIKSYEVYRFTNELTVFEVTKIQTGSI